MKTYRVFASGLLSTLPTRISTDRMIEGHGILEFSFLHFRMVVSLTTLTVALGLPMFTLHHGLTWNLVKEKVFAAQPLLAFPSTAREDSPPSKVDDCLVGLPLATFPAE